MILNNGLNFYNLFLEEKYLLNFKNYTNCDLNLDYKTLKKIIYNNILSNKSFIYKAKLGLADNFSEIYVVDNFKFSNYKNNLNYENFYNKNLFNLNFNQGLNMLDFEHNITNQKNKLKSISF